MAEQKPRITFAPNPELRDFVPDGEPSAILSDCRMSVAFHRAVHRLWPEADQQAAVGVAMGAAQDTFRAVMEERAAAAGFRLVWKPTERAEMRMRQVDANDPLAALKAEADSMGLALIGPDEAVGLIDRFARAMAADECNDPNCKTHHPKPEDWN